MPACDLPIATLSLGFNETGSSLKSIGHQHYLAVQSDTATSILLGLLSAAVAISLAITSWRLARHWRRRDNQRADLTDLAQALRRIHVQIQLLADQDAVATVTDCQVLRPLKYELDCAGGAFEQEVAAAIADVVARLDVLLAVALPTNTSVSTATLSQARAQGRAVQDTLAATAQAQKVVGRLRDR
ncbi:hypothetical protein [Streptomyces sp. ID05-47C]|uniref:hypothetical protein n=1 Tax=Streptomyces sp. ID05-47C TaxID=3028665 RepID=UPI0029A5D93F|nr:hypothetical protein [Streptomyces sp. ID05-47C]MDX3569304.1 hypothetical protein [Streptomyces sp. ID05-47C]